MVSTVSYTSRDIICDIIVGLSIGERWVYEESEMKFYETIFKIGERIERDPALKAEWNERVARDKSTEVSFLNL